MPPTVADNLAPQHAADARLGLSQTQAARALGVTGRTLRNWEKRGIILGHKVGGATSNTKLYAIEDLRRLVGR